MGRQCGGGGRGINGVCGGCRRWESLGHELANLVLWRGALGEAGAGRSYFCWARFTGDDGRGVAAVVADRAGIADIPLSLARDFRKRRSKSSGQFSGLPK